MSNIVDAGPGTRVILLHDPNSSDPVFVVGAILDPDDDAERILKNLIISDLFDPHDQDDNEAEIELRTWAEDNRQAYKDAGYALPPEELSLDSLEEFHRKRTDTWYELVITPWLNI